MVSVSISSITTSAHAKQRARHLLQDSHVTDTANRDPHQKKALAEPSVVAARSHATGSSRDTNDLP